MSDQTATIVILAVAILLFVSGRVPVSTVALGVAVSLWAFDVVTIEQAVGGFGTPTLVLIAALFVVVSMTVDILYAVLDPRLREAS